MEDAVGRGFPLYRQLLEVDDLISVHNLLTKLLGLCFVHGPDLLLSFVVLLLKALELEHDVVIKPCLLLEPLRVLFIFL